MLLRRYHDRPEPEKAPETVPETPTVANPAPEPEKAPEKKTSK